MIEVELEGWKMWSTQATVTNVRRTKRSRKPFATLVRIEFIADCRLFQFQFLSPGKYNFTTYTRDGILRRWLFVIFTGVQFTAPRRTGGQHAISRRIYN